MVGEFRKPQSRLRRNAKTRKTSKTHSTALSEKRKKNWTPLVLKLTGLLAIAIILTGALALVYYFVAQFPDGITIPERIMTVEEAFPLTARATVLEDGRTKPHDFLLYVDGARTAAVGNVSVRGNYYPATIIFEEDRTMLYSSLHREAMTYPGQIKLLYGILPPELLLVTAVLDENLDIFAGNISNTSYSFRILSWTEDGFIKEYEVRDASKIRYAISTVTFSNIVHGPIVDSSVFEVPEGTAFHEAEEFEVMME